mgnify:CR=1 FL=1
MKKITSISAFVAALISAVPVNAELPLNYRNWPVRESGSGQTTYKESAQTGAPVVREFQTAVDAPQSVLGVPGNTWLRINFTTIGYNPGSNVSPGRKPLEVYISLEPKYGLSERLVENVREMVIRNCQQCHPVTNSGNRF